MQLSRADSAVASTLARRERYRDAYWRERDPILEDRLLWRAQTFRHTVHLLPGQKILELGCGGLQFTRALRRVSRGENPITAVTFQPAMPAEARVGSEIELLQLREWPGALAGRRFDCVIAMDLLDRGNSYELLRFVHDLLVPGGEIVFYESNPRNPIYRLRGMMSRFFGRRDPRALMSRARLSEALVEIGFIRVEAIYNDFVYAPLTRPLIWLLRNLSILLENTPGLRPLAGSILLHGRKPSREAARRPVSLCDHETLRGAVSIVIPCRDEEMNVRPLVERLLGFFDDYIREIILIDDGSSDRTRAVMAELAEKEPRVKPLHRRPPHGVGRALAAGLAKAEGPYVLMMDCDFQDLLPELRDLFDKVAEGFDVVIGSRFSRHSVLLNYPFLKIVANRAFHAFAAAALGRRLRDVTNNLKIMRREVVQDLRLRQPGFAVNAETGLQPLLLGYRVAQVPISWFNRTPGMGTSSFVLAHVGGGYAQVLLGLGLKRVFGLGPYRDLHRGSASEPLLTGGKKSEGAAPSWR